MIILENEIQQTGLNGLLGGKCKKNDKRKKCGGKGTGVGKFLSKAAKVVKKVAPALVTAIPIVGGTVGKLIEKSPKLAASLKKVKTSKVGKFANKQVIKGKKAVKQAQAIKKEVVANLTPEQKSTISAVTGVDITKDNVVAPVVTTPSAPSTPPIVADNDGVNEPMDNNTPINESSGTGAEQVITGDEVNEKLTDAQAETIAQMKGVEVEQVKKDAEPKTEATKNNMPLILGGIAVVAIGAYALS